MIFDGSFDDMRRRGGTIKNTEFRASEKPEYSRRERDDKPRREFKRGGERGERREGGFKRGGEHGERGDRPMRRRREDGDRGVNPMRRRRENGDRGENPIRTREDGTRVYRTERPYKEDSPRRTFSFHGPRLGEDKERPVFKGRRNGWKRRDATAGDDEKE